MSISHAQLAAIADAVGTPVHILDGDGIVAGIRSLKQAVGDGVFLRYAMKANPSRWLLELMRDEGIGIDAGSGNEVARAAQAGITSLPDQPTITLSCDVLRDGAAALGREHGALVVVGSPGMIDDLIAVGYEGPIGIRVNPGFGHGHVDSCDTGGPSSKHGIWITQVPAVLERAAAAGLRVVLLHAHVGSGPLAHEYLATTAHLVPVLAQLAGTIPGLERVSVGGGLPVPYRPSQAALDLDELGALVQQARAACSAACGRDIIIELEPGRWFVAEHGQLVTEVTDIKTTETNAKGQGRTFVMVDAGFVDLIRPAMYGSWHGIEHVGDVAGRPVEEVVVAGPLCESGDVFTRDGDELVVPRRLPRPQRGDLLSLRHAGAYGTAMSSNYLSVGRAPVVVVCEGHPTLVSRRESLADVTRLECSEPLALA